jgi:hypothetical protein
LATNTAKLALNLIVKTQIFKARHAPKPGLRIVRSEGLLKKTSLGVLVARHYREELPDLPAVSVLVQADSSEEAFKPAPMCLAQRLKKPFRVET